MSKIAYVFDSTTIIPDDVKEKIVYEVVPLHVTVDSVNRPEPEIKDEEIVSRLEFSKDLKSSSPSIGEFDVAYKKLFDKGFEDIIVVVLSKENSATYEVAKMAIDLQDADKKSHIFVINTLINNYGLSNVVSAIGSYMEKDLPAEQMAVKAQECADNSHMMFTILDLKHLVRGGRLSKLSAAIGILFKIKPIIEMIDGKLSLTHKERTASSIITIFLAELARYATKFKTVFVRFVYLGEENKANVDIMLEKVTTTFKNVICTSTNRVGPVFHVHLGNAGFGISMTGIND